mgnify:FL=1
MALAVDTATDVAGAGAGPFTWSHTCAGSDRVLLVGISYYDSGDTVSAITYNSVAMTVVPSSTVSNGQYTVSFYRLIAPATGSNTVSVTFTGNVFDFKAGSVSFTGADQTTPLGTAVTATGSSTTPSVTVTSATGEIVLDTLVIVHSGTLTVDGSQAQRWNGTGGFGFIKGGGSTEAGASSTTMSWSNSTSQDWAVVGVPVKPVAAASTLRQLCLTGVGT